MSEEFLVNHCSPTLAGIKTGALFPCPGDSFQTVTAFCRDFNERMTAKGLCCIPLRRESGSPLIYLFRPQSLHRDLASPIADYLLSEKKYPVGNPTGCLSQLCRVLRKESQFPHEIGLFLGYPPEDVEGFIRNGGNGAKCVGTWKVYGDEQKAKETFRKYKQCTKVYKKMYEQGTALEHLAVTVKN